MLVTKTTLSASTASVTTTRIPTAKPSHDRPLTASDVLTGVPTLGAITRPDRKVLRTDPTVLSVPNEVGDALPAKRSRVLWPAPAVPRDAKPLPIAAAKPSGALAVRPTAKLLGLSNGPTTLAYGQMCSRANPTAPAATFLRAEEERIAGAPTAITVL